MCRGRTFSSSWILSWQLLKPTWQHQMRHLPPATNSVISQPMKVAMFLLRNVVAVLVFHVFSSVSWMLNTCRGWVISKTQCVVGCQAAVAKAKFVVLRAIFTCVWLPTATVSWSSTRMLNDFFYIAVMCCFFILQLNDGLLVVHKYVSCKFW